MVSFAMAFSTAGHENLCVLHPNLMTGMRLAATSLLTSAVDMESRCAKAFLSSNVN